MKITKKMGRAAIRAMKDPNQYDQEVEDALHELGWSAIRLPEEEQWQVLFDPSARAKHGEYQTALAMCAAIAGVKP